MRTYFNLILTVFASAYLQAQDTLYKTDGSEHIVKVLEVNDTQVKYKQFSNQEGPLYVIGKDYVVRIKFANGLIEEFPESQSSHAFPGIKLDPRATDFGRNFISINILDLFLENTLTFGYEHTFKSGLFSLKMPISFRLNSKGYSSDRKEFGIGLDFNLYPYGQGKAKFFYGPSFEYKTFDLHTNYLEINSAYVFLFQAGYLFQPAKHLNISITAGIGYARLIRDDYTYYSYGDVAARAGLNIGYKF